MNKVIKSARMAILASLVAGCGVVESTEMAVDGALVDADAGLDATPTACDLEAPFGPATRVDGINSNGNEWSVWMSDDERVAYFGSDHVAGDNNLFVATRDTRDSSFRAPAALSNLNSQAVDARPTLTRDGLGIIFVSDRAGTIGGYDLFMATRSSTAASFDPPFSVANVNDMSNQESPYWTPDGDELYFISGKDIVVAPRRPDGAFDTPTPVAGVNSAANQYAPIVSNDALTMFFARSVGTDAGDMMVARRSTTGEDFGTPVPVAELNTPGIDFPQALSPDGCRLYFLSNQQPDSVGMDVFVASRPSP